MESIRPQGLQRFADRPFSLHLQIEARRSGCLEATDQGDMRDARAVWLSPCACVAAT